MNVRKIRFTLCVVLIFATLLVGCQAVTPTEVEEESTSVPSEEETVVEAPEEEEVACPTSTVSDPNGVPAGKWPQQYTLAEYEELANCQMTFNSRGEFDQRLENLDEFFGTPNVTDDLPPVEERLPEEPLVVQPYESIGKYGGTLHTMSLGPSSGGSEYLSIRHVNLVRFLEDGSTIVPNVAKDYEVSDDGKTITFWLREGHKWSDGEPFTADDVLFWWNDIMLNKDLFPEVTSQWVFGGEPMEIEKISDTEFEIHLVSPSADPLLTWMAKTWIQMFAPKHAFEQFHPDYNADVLDMAADEGYDNWPDFFFANCYGTWSGTVATMGIPSLESHIKVEVTTDHKVFVANPYFFMVDTAGNQLPYIDQLLRTWGDYATIEQQIINGSVTYKAQSLDITSVPLFKEYEEEGNYTAVLASDVVMGDQITFNCTHEDPVLRDLFQNVKFKEAMSLAIDREEIAESVYFGLAEPQQYVPVNPDASFAKPEWYTYKIEYDPGTANELLDEIGLDQKSADGYRLRSDGEELVIDIVYTAQGANPYVLELVQQYWLDVGVRTKLKEVSTEGYRSLVSANDHDVATFTSGGTWEPMLRSNPYRLLPPFGDAALEPLCGGPWYTWNETNGEAGEEPPDDIKELFTLVDEWRALEKGTDEYIELGQEIIEINRDHFFHIGLVSNPKVVTIVSNDLMNVPEFTLQAWDLYFAYPFRGPQWYLEQ